MLWRQVERKPSCPSLLLAAAQVAADCKLEGMDVEEYVDSFRPGAGQHPPSFWPASRHALCHAVLGVVPEGGREGGHPKRVRKGGRGQSQLLNCSTAQLLNCSWACAPLVFFLLPTCIRPSEPRTHFLVLQI